MKLCKLLAIYVKNHRVSIFHVQTFELRGKEKEVTILIEWLFGHHFSKLIFVSNKVFNGFEEVWILVFGSQAIVLFILSQLKETLSKSKAGNSFLFRIK